MSLSRAATRWATTLLAGAVVATALPAHAVAVDEAAATVTPVANPTPTAQPTAQPPSTPAASPSPAASTTPPPATKTIKVAGRPRITGTGAVGKKLKVKMPKIRTKAVTIRYAWQRNGKTIKGATKKTYRLKPADAGARVSVVVVAAKTGYATKTLTSKAVKVKRAKKVTKVNGTKKPETPFTVTITVGPKGTKATWGR